MKSSSSILVWIGLVIIASLGLYRTSDRVNQLSHNLTQLNASIEQEHQSIHVLNADWVYLANPERIEKVVRRHLALRPTAPEQFADIKNLADIIPIASGQLASNTNNTAPLATVKSSFKARFVAASHALVAHVNVTHLAAPHKPTTLAAIPVSTEVASIDTDAVNDHMIMQRTASAQPLPDSIGAMISGMDAHQ